jgi:hypothetical protein
MDLQNTFYIIGIIYMSLMTIIIIALVIAVFAIKAKINEIHRQIEDRLHAVIQMVKMGEAVVDKARDFADRHKK